MPGGASGSAAACVAAARAAFDFAAVSFNLDAVNDTTRTPQQRRDAGPGGRAPPPSKGNADSGPNPRPSLRMPPRRTLLTFVVVLIANYLIVRMLMPSPDAPITVPP